VVGGSFKLNSKKNTFATLTSVLFFEKPIGVRFRKELLSKYNERPSNIYGDHIRIIILDNGFREGVDLFDVKYVHLFEPLVTRPDEKQAIGRATRFCGQKGLDFDSKEGWPLQVFRYVTDIPKEIQKELTKIDPGFEQDTNFFDAFIRYSNIDPNKIALSAAFDKAIEENAVDLLLNVEINQSKEKEKEVSTFQKQIFEKYKEYKWPRAPMENGCVPREEKGKRKIKRGGNPTTKNETTSLTLNPTQNFISTFFTPKSKTNGLLLVHSVGCGKTATAIATASRSFEPKGYTIIFVTRHTLKAEIWKNVFENSAHALIQEMVEKGETIPESNIARSHLVSRWMPPMSYKQFSNMLKGKNALYKTLLQKNGLSKAKMDPLYKTLIIIDEAHKLNAQDISTSERPDLEFIRNTLHRSYTLSGDESAKLLLMTATPYTSDPMDFIKLLNLMRPADRQFPEALDTFSKSNANAKSFSKELQGYISYLNREHDRRTFAHAIIQEIHVPMSDYPVTASQIQSYLQKEREINSYRTDIQNTLSHLKSESIFLKADMTKKYKNDNAHLYEEYTKCVEEEEEKRQKVCEEKKEKFHTKLEKKYAEATEELSKQLKECGNKRDAKTKECKLGIKAILKELTADKRFDLKEFNKKIKEDSKCKTDKEKGTDKECATQKEVIDKMETKQNILVEEAVKAIQEKSMKKIKDYEEIVNFKEPPFLEMQKQINKSISSDRSQRRAIESRCFKQNTPLYRNWMRGHFGDLFKDIEDEDDEEGDEGNNENKEEEGNKRNKHPVYTMIGHGSEALNTFHQRKKMPEDKMLILFSVCGRSTYSNNICLFEKLFASNDPLHQKWLKNPILYKDNIEQHVGVPIHIYLPGDRMPNITNTLFLQFEVAGQKHPILTKSGVFKMGDIPPINRSVLRQAIPSLRNCDDFIGEIDDPDKYTKKVYREVYKGNVFPIEYKPYHLQKTQHYHVSQVFDVIGPGIFYYVGCRSMQVSSADEHKYMEILEQSAQQQRFDTAHRPDKLKRVRDLNAKLKKLRVVNSSSPSSPSPDDDDDDEANDTNDTNDTNAYTPSPSPKNTKTKKEPNPLTKLKKELAVAFLLDDDARVKLAKEKQKDWARVIEGNIVEEEEKNTKQNKLKLKPLARWCKHAFELVFKKKLDNDNYTTSLKFQKKQGNTMIYTTLNYVDKTNKTNKFTVTLQENALLCVIPKDMISKKYKCESDDIVNKLKKLHKENPENPIFTSDDFPKTIDDWKKMNVFDNMCKRLRVFDPLADDDD
jgi:hypothetical protein